MGIPMLKMRRSRDRLIFNIGIPILVRRHIYIEAAPRHILPQKEPVFLLFYNDAMTWNGRHITSPLLRKSTDHCRCIFRKNLKRGFNFSLFCGRKRCRINSGYFEKLPQIRSFHVFIVEQAVEQLTGRWFEKLWTKSSTVKSNLSSAMKLLLKSCLGLSALFADRWSVKTLLVVGVCSWL